jgi:carbon storage regulator
MLALARRVNESIIINDNIEVTILEIKGDQIKIGVSAPKSVPVYRKEIYSQVQNSNKEAAQTVDPTVLSELLK